MRGRTEFEIGFTETEPQPVVRGGREGPLRILVLGDFGGRASRGLIEVGESLADRPTPAVDIDNFDDLLFRFAPRLHLSLLEPEAPSIAVEFKGIDDFHPDALYRNVEVFRAMREMREGLLDPGTSDRHVEEWRQARSESEALLEDSPVDAADPGEDDGAMFERLLGRKPSERPQARKRPPSEAVDLMPFIRRVVQPYVVAAPSAQQDHLVTAIDQATGLQMRELLRDPSFQALESAWRGIDWLVRRVETGENLHIHLLDVSKEELVSDLGSTAGNVRDSALHRLLVARSSRTLEENPWSLLAGLFTFGTGQEDVALLEALGEAASASGASFVAAAAPDVLGCRSSLAEEPDPAAWQPLDEDTQRRWTALRRSAAARWLGLALPRLLLRLPYGARTDPTEAFVFEEQPPDPEHEGYLWGNPSIACAMLVARAFEESGWEMQPGEFLDIEDLPAHHYQAEGETRMTPCAEAYLTETAATTMLDHGLMPIVSFRGRNEARLLRFQSLADPAEALSGPWR